MIFQLTMPSLQACSSRTVAPILVLPALPTLHEAVLVLVPHLPVITVQVVAEAEVSMEAADQEAGSICFL